MAKKGKTVKKKVVKKNIARGIVHIYSSFNNCIITVTDLHGNAIAASSSGVGGVFKGSRKSTPFAAQVAAENVVKTAMEHGFVEAHVRVKGPGAGRETAVRALGVAGIKILSILDVTPIPHNGCRPPKQKSG